MIIGILVLIGILLFQAGDIKELVKRNYKRARRLMIGSRPPKATDLPTFYPSGLDFRVVPTGRMLIRGGTVLSLDPNVGDFATADVLIEHGEIVEVGPGLAERGSRGDRRVGHDRHAGLRRLPSAHLGGPPAQHRNRRSAGGRSGYISFVLHKLAPAFRPEDAYIGDLISALGAIDAGITTLLDWSHIQGSPGPHRRGDPGAAGLRPAGGVRLRVPVVGQVGGASAQLVRPGGDRALLHDGPDAHAGARRARPGVHRLRGDPRPLEAGPGGGSADHDPRGRGELRTGREAPRDGRGGSPRARHDLHPLHHAERHRDPDDRRHGRHGVARVAGGDDDGPRDAPDPEVPRPGSASEPERGCRDQRAGRHVQPDALGADAATGIGDRAGQVAAPSEGGPGLRHDRRGQGDRDSTRRWGP